MAALRSDPSSREALETICEAFLPVDERRRRAMLVFLLFGTAALTDETLQGPQALRRGQGLADVLADQLRRSRSDEHVDNDAMLLMMAIVGLSNGQERLGHSSISVTLDTYSHAVPQMQEEAASQVADLLDHPEPARSPRRR